VQVRARRSGGRIGANEPAAPSSPRVAGLKGLIRRPDRGSIHRGGSAPIESKIGAERRGAAPHPGPIVKRDYLDPLGIDTATLAAHVDLDVARLDSILSGVSSFDVDSAVRLSRALGLPAERLMQMQTRYDFALARGVARLNDIDVIAAGREQPFASGDAIRGRLGRASDPFGDGSLYFQDEVARKIGSENYAGFHALWRGDRLRVFEPSGSAVWTGPILQNLDGRILLPFVRTAVWQSWFDMRFRADLEIGEEHAAFFRRMRDA
jgi:addiction module HigA family antidote